jgi:oxygen-dependent protoporphyrinogen oxidase
VAGEAQAEGAGRAFDVAVAGGGIAGLVAAREAARAGRSVVLLEASGRLGGTIRTVRRDGFELEAGPDNFLTRKPAAADLCRELGVDVQPARTGALIQRRGRLVPLPGGLTGLVPGALAPLLGAQALSARSRLRAALEPLVPRRTPGGDESLEAFAVRRFGRGAWDELIAPLLGGLYGHDAGPISLHATLPHLHGMERAGPMLRLRAPARQPDAPPAFARPVGGMQSLVEALERDLRERGVDLRPNAPVDAVGQQEDGRYVLHCNNGSHVTAGALVVALPPHAAAPLLGALDPALARPLADVPLGSGGAVFVAFRRDHAPRLPDASGWLVPHAEARRAPASAAEVIQAVTLMDTKHPGAAPPDHEAARLFVRPESVYRSDGNLVEAARAHLSFHTGLDAPPLFTLVHRWQRSIPRYTLGHVDRREAWARAAQRHGRLALVGASLHGIGLPDVIADARERTQTLLQSAPHA